MQTIFKKLRIVVLLTSIISSIAIGQIISQYIETNSGTIPKGIEIWNNTAGVLDFSANNLVIEKGTNGGTPSADYTLNTDTLAAGAVIVIGTSDLQTTTESNGSVFYLKAFTFNGDDALVVKYGGVITDMLGISGVDPGSAWTGSGVSTANQNIKLIADITTGDTDGWTDPSTRFEVVSTNPIGDMSDFGIAPVISSSSPDDPTSFTATAISSSQINLSWTNNALGNEVMIVYDTDNTFTDPIDGTSYMGSALGGTVIYQDVTEAFSHTGLNAGTTYYYKAWSNDAGDDKYSTGVTASATTIKAEPSNHPSTFASTSDHNSITVTWADNDGAVIADGFLIKASSSTIEDIPPAVDGTAEADDTDLSDGSAIVNISHGTGTYTFTGLTSETMYYFVIWAYNNSGTTIDYKTDRPLVSQSIATTAAPSYILNLDFESAGGYTTSVTEFHVDGDTYFERTNGTDIVDSFTNTQGSSFFAAQDIDGNLDIPPLYLTIEDVDISGYTEIVFSVHLAEGDDGTNQDWDASDYMHISYDIDNSGNFSNLLWVENDGTTYNTAPQIDTDFDGIGEGAEITSEFTEYTAPILGSGSTIDIKIEFNGLTSADEDIALDNIRLTGTGSTSNVDPEPSAHITDLAGTSTYKSITLTWLDNNGETTADNFLICASTVSLSAINNPSDGIEQSNDTDLSDGNGTMNINTGVQNYIWTGLSETTSYYFKIFPYTNSGADIDYKTDGTIPSLSLTTGEMPDIIITELMINPDSTLDNNGEWIELYNAGTETVNIDGWILSDNGTDAHTISNGGTLNIAVGEYLVLGIDSSRATNGDYPCDYEYSNFSLANSADEVILKDGATVIDSVAYDEAANWIIPVGASTVFIGTPNEDNNLYTQWATSTLRLDNFTGSVGDKGSPGTSSVIDCILNVKLFLEGAF
jgi:Lamin Tail Domain